MTVETLEARCQNCGDPVVPVEMPHGKRIVPFLCRPCAGFREAMLLDKAIAAREKDLVAAREAHWLSMCPHQYRKTDPCRIPDTQGLQHVMEWQHGPRGLLAWGPTGTGKTRAVMLLVRRLVLFDGLRVVAFLGNSFAHQCGRVFGDHTSDEWLHRVNTADVVVLDDLGKFRLTERVESELFGVVEHRTSWNLPVIATMNAAGAQLVAKLSPDRGDPLVRRLREFCGEVKFTHPKTGGGQ